MRVPIGIDNFKDLITKTSSLGEHYIYTDKTMMIRDILDENALISLFTRPRRFGKSLNMSMLFYFFDIAHPENRNLFDGLEISKHSHIMDRYCAQYPVIFLSFRGVKASNFEDTFVAISDLMRQEFDRHRHTFKANDPMLSVYSDITKPLGMTDVVMFILRLSAHLHKYYDAPAVVLIDEYDVPMQVGFLNGFYKEIGTLMRNLFESGLKGNNHIYKGALTGVTRIAKESMFSGLNHFWSYDIDSERYSQYFGFTEPEVQAMLPEHFNEAREWYNGYIFGKETIYNPWSILNFIHNDFKFEAYWINTSSNDLAQHSMSADKMRDVKNLINDGTVETSIDHRIVFNTLKEDADAFWNLLYTAGYLTLVDKGLDIDDRILRIPNLEVKEFFRKIAMNWFDPSGESPDGLKNILKSLLEGDPERLQELLQRLILETFSFHDVTKRNQESFYHGFILGITLGLRNRYVVKSNRESGYGRYDIALIPNDPIKNPGVIIEVKLGKDVITNAGILQIQDKEYATELKQHGCKSILLYGLRFDGKEVVVDMVE